MAGADSTHGGAYALAQSVPATPANVSELRHAVCDLARRAGAGDLVLADVALAVGEACGNAALHAYPAGEDGPLHVHACVENGALVVEIADQGRGLVPRSGSQGLGLGLPLMSALARDIRVGPGPGGRGTGIELRFDL